MSITVETIDEKRAKELLKGCPKEVQDYVKALEHLREINKQTLNQAMAKIKELSQLKK